MYHPILQTGIVIYLATGKRSNIIEAIIDFRWGQTPKDEALRFNHAPVAELIQSYIDKKPSVEEPVEDAKAKVKDQGSIGSIW